ncbi:hypothetical protein ONS95_006657 [Cadophora gregata]|uniref:uncharacterized protein n=1 Tax=Cadophora gregata TaxID=51156 RepID=UPI0026DC6D1F|nr:uncharacterized protein ONS95_006657 [Cadophora gregata]KAK0101487.1 hypothetical protein ONS95_006657 [Cadophora gregata]KAK0106502.1 hypothetical protein ONS96_004127 [Cadophora gregata f. sp. sojae]
MNMNNGLFLRSAGLHPTQCTYCQLDPYTGEHICDCATQNYLASIGYGSPQQILVSAANCTCPQCPYQVFLGGGTGLLSGGFQLAAASPLNKGFGMTGGLPVNPALGIGAFQMNPLAFQSMSPFGAAGLGGATALSMGMLGQGFAAQHMLSQPMAAMNRRGFGRGAVNRLGSSPFCSSRWGGRGSPYDLYWR